MRSILICIDWYYPAFKAGGPIHSVFRLVSALSDSFEIFILTSAYDLKEEKMMENIVINQWVPFAPGVKVYYASKEKYSFNLIKKLLSELQPDSIYFYSPFSRNSTIDVVRAAHAVKLNPRYILAPRGTLKPSALKKNKFLKSVYFQLIKIFNLHKKFSFHATNEQEKHEVEQIFGPSRTYVIDNLPPPIEECISFFKKESSALNICCIGRFHPIKNIHFVLELLQAMKTSSICFTIVGSKEDHHYFDRCNKTIKDLPANIKVHLIEEIPNHKIKELLQAHHLMVLPTLGENYGNAIIESLAASRPVLISDQTPWKKLQEYHAGWELPLSDKQAWIKAIEEAASWDQAEFDKHCQGALVYARAHTKVEELVEKYREMFGGSLTDQGRTRCSS
ncbi:MAG: glycosyltransferase [Saprospiraceae bacterium]|nr:glycosyltransferase [Saprospiraceae bacterium]